jgi:CO/xanthine dehydrogenase FAD-binding subunit
MALRTIKPFKYFQPSTLVELLPLVEKFGSEGKIMAGGTDLVVQLKTREVPPLKYIFDIENIEELHYIRDEGETLRIGSMVKLRTLKASPVIRKKTFILAEAVRSMATPQIRTMGTIGGNLCNASPGADTAPPLLSLGARLKILSTKGERIVPIENFFASVKRTALRSGELVTEIIVPCQPDGYGGAFMKVGRRVGHDISVANVAVVVKLKKDCVEDVRIALGSVAPTPMRAIETEAFLKGKACDQGNITRAAEIASTEIRPISDIRASAEYRRDVVKSLIEMAIQRAAERIRSARW